MARDEAQAIVGLIERLARAVRAQAHEGGLNPAQWEALRYLKRANRFSNSPIAVARYLGATKGTISQTLIALERKRLIAKAPRADRRRSLALTLTPEGEAMLALGPARHLEEAAANLSPKTRKRLSKGLDDLLARELVRSGAASFGACRTCRFFRERGAEAHERGPHLCLLFDEPLSAADSRLLCVEHSAN
jgi:DNA-binding MarR family transcriptional regulator